MVITVCIGSSCHLKGSKEIVQTLEKLIANNNLVGKVTLNGSFCLGECTKGVCVKRDGELFSLTPDTAEQFFQDEVLAKLA